MINFRFHLASLIAVFLALAIGIVMGSTVVKEATVKGLRAEIHRVERSSNARQRWGWTRAVERAGVDPSASSFRWNSRSVRRVASRFCAVTWRQTARWSSRRRSPLT